MSNHNKNHNEYQEAVIAYNYIFKAINCLKQVVKQEQNIKELESVLGNLSIAISDLESK